VYLDIVELLRPLLGEDMYRENKLWYLVEKRRRRNRVYNALLVDMCRPAFPEWFESDEKSELDDMLDFDSLWK
jgi:hypothetical protein